MAISNPYHLSILLELVRRWYGVGMESAGLSFAWVTRSNIVFRVFHIVYHFWTDSGFGVWFLGYGDENLRLNSSATGCVMAPFQG